MAIPPENPAAHPPSKTALLLLDFHQLIVDTIQPREAQDRLCHGIQTLLRSARANASPVVHAMMAGFSDDAAPASHEITVYKRPGCVSALKTPELLRFLKEQHAIESVVICGVITSGAVLSTAREAADLGFTTTVVEEGCWDYAPETHEVVLRKVLPMTAWVVKMETALKLLNGESEALKDSNLRELRLSAGRNVHTSAATTLLVVAVAIPLGGSNGVDMLDVHEIYLLQSAVLGLNDEEEDNDNQGTAASGKDQAIQVVNLVGDEADTAVAQRVQLRVDGPDEGTPGDGESHNGKTREGDENAAGGRGIQRVCLVNGKVSDKGVDQKAHHHPGGTNHENRTSSPLAHDPKGHNRSDDLRDVAVFDAGRLEHCRSKVEEVVDADELLPTAEDDAQHRAVEHARAGEDLGDAKLLGQLALFVDLVLDVVDLVVHSHRVLRQAREPGNRGAGLVGAAVGVRVPRRLGEEENERAEEQGPGKRQAVGDAPRGAAGLDVAGAKVDHLGEPDAKGDEELVRGDDDAADRGGRALGLVHGHDDGQGADAQARDEPADGELHPADGDGEPAAEHVGHLAGDEGADEGADADEANDCPLSRRAELVLAAVTALAESSRVVVHGEEARDLTAAEQS
ncbi:hypothetical protein LLEC1_06905 [Akanthomyces lecanii]|uniref:Isochorismatase-like domain-containing protein n=1 Tax=Cordyceps confragosa TaxID=2714763 RepID=A0A179I956_CORDF|nr:hypothetical protein LLEC1_06905 [Akanthomyces lecanii]